MNIFALDRDPKIAAEMMCDKHIVKMITESYQMFSSVLDDYNLNAPTFGMPGYPKSVSKHPCTIWTKHTKGNYKWHADHLYSMCAEYWRRYNKIHKFDKLLRFIIDSADVIKWDKYPLEDFVIAIQNKKWHRSDPVESYRVYYNMEKFIFAKWKDGNVPYWFTGAPHYTLQLDKVNE